MKKSFVKIFTSILLCVALVLSCCINVFALSTGPKSSNKLYNSTSYFMIDGTLYEAPQSKYSYNSGYDQINGTYYMIDGCNITSKNSIGSARRFYLYATTTKRSNLASIYANDPFNSAPSSILYSGSGDISCTVNPNAGFPLGTRTNTVSGTETYCEIYVAVTYNGKARSTGTVTCRKPYASGTISVDVEAYWLRSPDNKDT